MAIDSETDAESGKGAYEDLIAIYEEIGEEIRPVLEKKLLDISAGY